MQIDGQCHCGAVRYEAEVDPQNVFLCHCTDCQTISGAPYRTSVAAPLQKLQITGAPNTYRKTADSGRQVTTAFCGRCGTALYSQGDGRDFAFLRVGAIRQRLELPPKQQGFCDSGAPWALDITGVPKVAPAPQAI